MMLFGLMSRWITPCECVIQRATITQQRRLTQRRQRAVYRPVLHPVGQRAAVAAASRQAQTLNPKLVHRRYACSSDAAVRLAVKPFDIPRLVRQRRRSTFTATARNVVW
jgi:hypothetical protein